MILFYRVLVSLVTPLLVAVFAWRALRGRESWADLGERMGGSRPSAVAPSIWLHGASNGELAAAKPVLEDLTDAHPETRVLVTSNTVTARAMVRDWHIPGVEARLAPLDLRWALRRVLRAYDVRAFVLLEGDFWPNRQITVRNAGLPALLVGGRISKGSARNWARFGTLGRTLFGSFAKVWPQSGEAAEALAALGAQTIAPVLDLKAQYDGTAAPDPMFDRAATWLAASTHDGEDAVVLAAHELARAARPDLRLILAPRHPRRADDIAALARDAGLSIARRSANDTQDSDVYLADTLGEMPVWYASAHACFVAGSLVPKGGHTPFEPIAHGTVVLHGPHTENFASIYDRLDAQNAALEVGSADALAAALVQLADPAQVKTMTARAKMVTKPAHGDKNTRNDILRTLDQLAFWSARG